MARNNESPFKKVVADALCGLDITDIDSIKDFAIFAYSPLTELWGAMVFYDHQNNLISCTITKNYLIYDKSLCWEVKEHNPLFDYTYFSCDVDFGPSPLLMTYDQLMEQYESLKTPKVPDLPIFISAFKIDDKKENVANLGNEYTITYKVHGKEFSQMEDAHKYIKFDTIKNMLNVNANLIPELIHTVTRNLVDNKSLIIELLKDM